MTGLCTRCRSAIPPDRFAACPVCLLKADLPPVVLGGHYELGEEIGRGGMGAVHKALDRRLGRTVAVKLLSDAVASREEFRVRFEREGRALAKLSHPNIVSVFDVGEEDGRRYIVMEYVDGRPLDRLVPMAPDRAVGLALQVCDALAAAHGQGIVHRDIKPGNILVDGADRVKVADFGIARFVEPGSTVTSSTEVLGTPAYMAPEVLRGAAPDPRQDVYAVGMMLTEMIPPGSRGGLEPVLDRALAPTPERRYSSMAELRSALSSAGSGGLPADESLWLNAAALLRALAIAASVWAMLATVTPRTTPPGEIPPLAAIARRTLPDGTVHTLARFEPLPTFAALALIAAALAATAGLRRHWRTSGLEENRPDRPLRESGAVLVVGLVACGVFLARKLLERAGAAWATAYIPVLGGFIELAALYVLSLALLQAARTGRPLRREPRLWIGGGLALLPPAVNLVLEFARWNIA